jgi:hypothetical protein
VALRTVIRMAATIRRRRTRNALSEFSSNCSMEQSAITRTQLPFITWGCNVRERHQHPLVPTAAESLRPPSSGWLPDRLSSHCHPSAAVSYVETAPIVNGEWRRKTGDAAGANHRTCCTSHLRSHTQNPRVGNNLSQNQTNQPDPASPTSLTHLRTIR